MPHVNTASPNHIWYSHCGYSPFAMAIQLGWIADELSRDGIALKSVKRDGSAQDRLSHYDHHLPFSIRQGGSTPAIWARSRGAATRLIGVSWLDEYQAVVALPGSGIRSVRDLVGRRLALPSANHPVDHVRASNLRGLSVAFELEGYDVTRDVELVSVSDHEPEFTGPDPKQAVDRPRDGSRATDALVSGAVDAVFLRGPRGLALAESLGAVTVTEISEHRDPLVRANNGSPRPLTVDAHFHDARPDLVERLLRRITAIGHWAEHNAHEAARLIARQGGVSTDVVHRAYRGNLHRRLHTTLDDTAIEGLCRFKDFLAAHGFLAEDFEMSDWVSPEPLRVVQSTPLRLIA